MLLVAGSGMLDGILMMLEVKLMKVVKKKNKIKKKRKGGKRGSWMNKIVKIQRKSGCTDINHTIHYNFKTNQTTPYNSLTRMSSSSLILF